LEPGEATNKANRWGALKVEKQQAQLLTQYVSQNHANSLQAQRAQGMNNTNETLDLGRIGQMPWAIGFVGSWSRVPASQFCMLFLQKR
jgi:hypothetical protein